VYGLSHTHLMCWLHRMPGEAMMGLMSGVLGTHGYTRWPRATGHVVAPEPSRTRRRIWSHRARVGTGALSGGVPRSRGDTKAFLLRWQAQCLGACGDTGALSWWVACMMPQGIWRRWSPFLTGDTLCVMGHVATPEPSSDGWRALCLKARGRARAS
jgi:hypothetical protein